MTDNGVVKPGTVDLGAAQRLWLVAAAALVGVALHVNDGHFAPSALALIAAAFALTLAPVFVARPKAAALPEPATEALLVALVLVQILLLARTPALDLEAGRWGLLPLRALAGASALLVLAVAQPGRRFGSWPMLAFLAAHFLMGAFIITHSPPETDVHMFQKQAISALLDGRNPYALRFPNIYHPYEGFYGPGLVKHGVLQFGYPYPPLLLYWTLPAAVLGGDLRFAHQAALTIAGGLLCFARPGKVAFLATALLLSSPRVGLLIQMGWTEPVPIMFLAATVCCAARAPRLLPLSFGALLASKQYLVLLAPASWLLVGGPRRTRDALALAGEALLVALVVTLPLALWNPAEFVRSAGVLQFAQPFRSDALGLPALIGRVGGPRLDSLALFAGPLALVASIVRLPPAPAGFAAAAAATMFAFFVFSKQGFLNYYFFVVAALCASAASISSKPAHGPGA